MFWTELNKNMGLDKYNINEVVEVEVIVEKEIFLSEENFGIYLCENVENEKLIIKGNIVNALQSNSTYMVKGKVINGRDNEKQLLIYSIKSLMPYNKKGIIAYLQTLSGLKQRAESIFEVFGLDSIEKLIHAPQEVADKVNGVGLKSTKQWSMELKTKRENEEILISLLDYGLTIQQIRKLLKKYQIDILIKNVKENPYFLSLEVKGYSFKKCDDLAYTMNIPLNSIYRTKAGILHLLSLNEQDGHVYMNPSVLHEEVVKLLNIVIHKNQVNSYLENPNYAPKTYKYKDTEYTIILDEMKKDEDFIVDGPTKEIILEALKELWAGKEIVIDENKIYKIQRFVSEKYTAEKLINLAKYKNTEDYTEIVTTILDNYLEVNKITLEKEQYQSIINITSKFGGVETLEGSAGCGKTFTLNIIVKVLEELNRITKKYYAHELFALMAPTGRAAKVMTNAIGKPASTIHRGLAYQQGFGFGYNATNPLEARYVIVDEFTMIDMDLAYHLIQAIQQGAKLIMVGDIKQLPSIGPGAVFKEVIESNVIRRNILTVSKRQTNLSGLNKNAYRIINQEMIKTEETTKDSFLIEHDNPAHIMAYVIKSYQKLLAKYEKDEIQVLSPMRKGLLGVDMLNFALQYEFNEEIKNNKNIQIFNKEFMYDNHVYTLNFTKGDKVINLKNNKDKLWRNEKLESLNTHYISNGEIGVIYDIVYDFNPDNDALSGATNKKEKLIIVKYTDGYMIYNIAEAKEMLDHAYAITIHKSQGSQWLATIIPMHMSFVRMLENNLYYTAHTRAQEFSVTIGSPKAIHYAVTTFKSINRNTNLKKRLITHNEIHKV